MEPDELELLRHLLEEQRMLALAVMVDDRPYVGLLPFVIRPDLAALIVHASSLARHSKGLVNGGAFGALIHASDRPELDPLQLPRLSVQGSVRRIDRDQPAWREARDRYLEKYPSSRSVFQLGDFHLYELAIEKGRLIAGFGRISSVNASTLERLGELGSS